MGQRIIKNTPNGGKMSFTNVVFKTSYRSKAVEYLLVCAIGGVFYFTLEVLWRGWSHVSMAICGALCFSFFYYIEDKIRFRRLPLIFKAIVGGVFISALELVAGLVLNKLLHLRIWDYSHMPLDFLGQICLQMSILWVFVSFAAFLLCDIIRRNIFLRS